MVSRNDARVSVDVGSETDKTVPHYILLGLKQRSPSRQEVSIVIVLCASCQVEASELQIWEWTLYLVAYSAVLQWGAFQ